MGQAEPEVAAMLGEQDGSAAVQLKQLKALLSQLKESRGSSEQELQNLRSELTILRKQQSGGEKTDDGKKDESSLELELNDAKKEILKLKRENAELRRNKRGPDFGAESGDEDATEPSEQVKAEMRRMKKKINKAVRQVEMLKDKKINLEYQLEVSRFRENEAVVFLRRFRSFYYMIWRNNVVRGSGGFVANKISVVQTGTTAAVGTPDDRELVDIDKLMIESGLLEKDEVGSVTPDDTSPYKGPSPAAYSRSSSVAAQVAQLQQRQAIFGGSSSQASGSGKQWGKHSSVNSGKGTGVEVPPPPRGPLSAIKPPESAKVIDARQKLEETPAGQYIVMREKKLEEEVAKLSDKLMQIEKELETEKRKKDHPDSETKVAQEANVLRKQLETKENDLRIIVAKLRESSIINWKMEESSKRLQEHIVYLEELLEGLEKHGTPRGSKSRRSSAAPKQRKFNVELERGPVEKTEQEIIEELRSQGSVAEASTSEPRSGSRSLKYSDQIAHENLLVKQQQSHQKKQQQPTEKGGESMTFRDLSSRSATLRGGDEANQERRNRSEACESGSEQAMTDSSSQRNFQTRTRAPQMRYVQPSPVEEWRRRKEAQGKGEPIPMQPKVENSASNALPPWMQKLRGNKPPVKRAEKDEGPKGGIPEFLRKFQTIGARNSSEVVVAAQGLASIDPGAKYRPAEDGFYPKSKQGSDSDSDEDESGGKEEESQAEEQKPDWTPEPEPEASSPTLVPTMPNPAPSPTPEPAPSPPPAPAPSPAPVVRCCFVFSS